MRERRDVIRAVEVRTRDDLAVIQDLPKGANQLGRGFPVTPVFDALSYFTLSWHVGWHYEMSSYVHDVTPLTYSEPQANADVDVVVTRLRAYKAEYAADSSDDPKGRTHLTLTPFGFVTAQADPKTTFFFHELYIDNGTGLPTRVAFEGADGKQFILDYGSVAGHWVIGRIHYEETLYGPLRLGRLHVIADVYYDQYQFPDTAPDPRLAG